MFDRDLSEIAVMVRCEKCCQNSVKPLSDLFSSSSVACHSCHALIDIDITRPCWRKVIRNALDAEKILAKPARQLAHEGHSCRRSRGIKHSDRIDDTLQGCRALAFFPPAGMQE